MKQKCECLLCWKMDGDFQLPPVVESKVGIIERGIKTKNPSKKDKNIFVIMELGVF